MDLVWLVRPGENEELRYSLRSTASLPGQRWIIGEPPPWVVTNVLREPRAGSSGVTTHGHLLTAVNCEAISDPFVLMNDDFYRLDDTAGVPDWHRGTVRQLTASLLRRHGRARAGAYVAGMHHVAQRLRDSEGFTDPLSFEYHAPLIVHKAEMRYALLKTVTHKRTYYGNLAARDGLLSPTEHDDVLVLGRAKMPDPRWGWCASTDASWRVSRVAELLQTLYPEPSRYEDEMTWA